MSRYNALNIKISPTAVDYRTLSGITRQPVEFPVKDVIWRILQIFP